MGHELTEEMLKFLLNFILQMCPIKVKQEHEFLICRNLCKFPLKKLVHSSVLNEVAVDTGKKKN